MRPALSQSSQQATNFIERMKDGLLAYRPRLDGLRCVAIGLVLVHHFGGSLASFFDGGYYGVDLFFVISGFLITGILIRDPHRSFAEVYRSFVGRRALRIFPAYYALLAVLLLLGVSPAREMVVFLATYTFNYAAALREHSGLDNPLYYLWSLSVEEQFYLLWPPLVILLRRRKGLLLAVTGAVVVLGYSQLLFGIVPAFEPFNYTGLFNRMGSLGMGALGSIYISWRKLPEGPFNSVAVELLVMGVLVLSLAGHNGVRFVSLGLCSLFLVIKAAEFDFKIRFVDRILTNKKVLYVGAISYGIYLYHVPIGILLTPNVVDPIWNAIPFDRFGPFAVLRWHAWILKLPLYTAVTIGVASISYRFLESPVLALKSRWFGYRLPTAPSPVDLLPQ